MAFCNRKVFSIFFIALELSHHGKMPNNTLFFFFLQINVESLMPQAYYMLCRKFPDSYNKESQTPYQLFRADQNCRYLELWSWMSELTSLGTVHMHPCLGGWCQRDSVASLSLRGIIIWTRYLWQLQCWEEKITCASIFVISPKPESPSI